MGFLEILNQARNEHTITERIFDVFFQLYSSYSESIIESGLDIAPSDRVFKHFLERVKEQLVAPFTFQSYHQKITTPFDYYEFGLDFVRPLVIQEKTSIGRKENLLRILSQINRNENVVLFANHQTEVDPQLFSISLEKEFPKLAKEVIFVAGDRVLTDPMAIPFSMGRNLLCIYSKRHINHPPQKKEEKQLHNQRTMKKMKELFIKGGQFIYVAPSGGRDRPNEKGEVLVTPFDPNSVEMFRLMAVQSGTPTHFYPLALQTYDILPPPPSIQSELGEMRKAKREGIFFTFGEEIDMAYYPGHDFSDRHARREALAKHLWKIVSEEYAKFKK
jgi:glycerol-3-phosphate O-acyltransferase